MTLLDTETVAHALRARADQQPQRLAFTFLVDGERATVRRSFGELDARARSIAARLRADLDPGDRVLLLFAPGLEFIEALFGCFYAGVVAVSAFPPNPGDLRRSAELLGLIVNDARPRVALTDALLEPFLRATFDQMPTEADKISLIALDASSDSASPFDGCPAAAGDVAMIQYTSGSVSAPKGVVLSHANLMANQRALASVFPTEPGDGIVSWLPLQHDMGLIGSVMHTIAAGLEGTLLSPLDFVQRPMRWLEAASRARAAILVAPNFGYELCVRKSTAEEREALDLHNVRLALTGAESVRSETLAGFASAFRASGFEMSAFRPVYGLAEATLIVTGNTQPREPVAARFDAELVGGGLATPVRADTQSKLVTHVSCGRAVAEHELRIVDPETLEPCAEQRVGEIWVRGPSIAQGYWRNELATARTFGATTASGEGPFLRTGDLGFCIDGELYIAGRIKELIIIRGRNLYPQDIELTMQKAHAALRSGCGAAFSVSVEGEERLVLVQELDTRKRVEHASVLQEIRQRVAVDHQVAIERICLIHPRTIPKTSSGKLRRGATRASFLAGSLAVVADDRELATSTTRVS